MNNLLLLSSLLILLVILLLNIKSGFGNINNNNTNNNTNTNQTIPLLIHYTVPVDGVYKWPLLYLIDTSEIGGNNADYFNNNSGYTKPPPGVLSGSNKYKEYLPNILNLKTLYSEDNIYLADGNTVPSIDYIINNNYNKEFMNKGDSPYFVVNINNNILKSLTNNNKYVLGIGLQLDKDYVNINGSIRYSKDPLIKYRYTNFKYFDLIYDNNKFVELNAVLGNTQIIGGDFVV